MMTDKEFGAFRVMEALSAVDEELLERSGKTTAESKNKMTVRRFVQRYAVACAACLCLMVLGAAYFGMSQIRMGSAENSKGMNMSDGSGDDFSPLAADGEMWEPEEMQENAAEYVPEPAEGAAEDSLGGELAVTEEPEWLDVEQLAALRRETEWLDEWLESAAQIPAGDNGGQAQNQNQTVGRPEESEGEPVQTAREKEVFRAKAAVPEGYSPVEIKEETGNPEDQGSLVYEWSDGEHSLWLRVTSTELTTDMLIEAEPPVYTVQQEWKELIPDAGTDVYARFALLYDNGMLVEYCGVLEREEIISLLESLTW